MTPETKQKIINIANQSEIARRVEEKPQTVNLWFKNGVPPKKVFKLCACLGWKVTPHEIAPDIYPNPSDGLPSETAA